MNVVDRDSVVLGIVFVLFSLFTASLIAQDRPPARAYSYQRLFRSEVRKAGLEDHRAMLAGQVMQESTWRHDAASPFANGLTQFTPATQEWINTLDPLLLELDDPINPRWAIRAQMVFMGRLLSKYGAIETPTPDDQEAFALVGYNAGDGWVNRERRATAKEGGDPLRWFHGVEGFCLRAEWACRESSAYVRRILYRWKIAFEGF